MADKMLRLRQLETSLVEIKNQLPSRPRKGWISEFRRALLMTAAQLAKRLNVDQSAVTKLERSEEKKTITLSKLERAAEALGCEVRYVLVPKTSLEKNMFERARKKLREEDKRLQHTLSLEGQSDYDNRLREDVETAYLMLKLGSRIWDD